MRSVSVVLLTEAGDELIRLPLKNWMMAEASETSELSRSRPDEELARLEAAIRALVRNQGLEIAATDPLDFEIALTRALLAQTRSPAVLLEVHVREPVSRTAGPRMSDPRASDPLAADPLAADPLGSDLSEGILDGLFDLDEEGAAAEGVLADEETEHV